MCSHLIQYLVYIKYKEIVILLLKQNKHKAGALYFKQHTKLLTVKILRGLRVSLVVLVVRRGLGNIHIF